MPDSYQLPAIALTALLLPAFVQLYLRSRQTRTLLWLLGYIFACLRMLQVYQLGFWDISDPAVHPWFAAAGQTCALISATLFMASLSPLSFRLGQRRILYAVPFIVPLAAYAILLNGVYRGQAPTDLNFLILPALGALALLIGCFWAFGKGSMPTWLGLALCIVMGGASLWVCVSVRGPWPLVFVEAALHLTTAMLVFYVFRRLTPGTMLSGLGMAAWTLNVAPIFTASPGALFVLQGVASMGKVVAAVGMIVLVLEDQLAIQNSRQEREFRTRKELEAYTNIVLSRRRVEDFDRQANLICQTVSGNSRFSQAALILLQSSGQYRLAGAAGIDDAAINALESLLSRIPSTGFLTPGSSQIAAEHSQSLQPQRGAMAAPRRRSRAPPPY